ncbi:loganic acid O-methyltransferase-like [Rosa rugosa]|uniref:loganic acid O-methyltransferase-like n=1 Tax=Rosa rugosa TaxID=74645 RepID=UPI002B40F196|nr:loganic acid O-methyltransferase-like [Rosa rugosa]
MTTPTIQYAIHRETERNKEMAAENTSKVFEAHPMKGGDGPNSYTKNSILQRASVDAAKELLNKAIAEKLDIESFLPSKSFRIADLGCSTGPNTFMAVGNILEAVESKYRSQGLNSQIPDFQVFFNDHASNDFNMLFQSLPQNRQYHAAGVPGSFYKQVLPNASINFAYSSTAIQWLSRVPTAVADSNSPAWNKGRIHYSNATDEVKRAYETQYSDDMESFLQARAQEIVYGGLIVLTFPGRHSDTPHSDALPNMVLQLLGASLMDLVRKGVVSEEKVDSFNIPVYSMSTKELAAAVERNGCFSIEMVADLLVPRVDDTSSMPQLIASHIRAGMEGILKQQFGEELLDELFNLYREKCEEHISTTNTGKPVNFLVVLRRKED